MYAELKRLVTLLDRTEKKAQKACDARASLPPGTSRARVTTANARWFAAAEARDRLLAEVREEIARLNIYAAAY